jgi:hypothetical protein
VYMQNYAQTLPPEQRAAVMAFPKQFAEQHVRSLFPDAQEWTNSNTMLAPGPGGGPPIRVPIQPGTPEWEKPPVGFSLKPGEIQYDAQGNPIAERAPEAKPGAGLVSALLGDGGPGQGEGRYTMDDYIRALPPGSQQAFKAILADDPAKAMTWARGGYDKVIATANAMGDDFRAETNDFLVIQRNYGNIKAAAKDATPMGDIALVFAYMKVLDPGSVVRESEQATVTNAGAVPDRIRNLYNKAILGVRLTPEQRADIIGKTDGLYQDHLASYRRNRDAYERKARAAGVPQELLNADYANPALVGGGDGVSSVPLVDVTPATTPTGDQIAIGGRVIGKGADGVWRYTDTGEKYVQ